jgi:hypothetical protein
MAGRDPAIRAGAPAHRHGSRLKTVNDHATAIILAAALLLRVAIALAFPNVIAFDEIYQFLEPAHRLVFGQGIVPWEYQVGLRGWLIPLCLAGLMDIARAACPDPLAGLILIRVTLCAASLSIVWCATKWGARCYGRPGLWITGGLAALWPDLWLLAPHTLEEVLAADSLLPAIYLVESPATRRSPRRTALAGLLLGLAVTLRIQLAPAIAIAGIALCRRDARSWRAALPAAALPLLAAGLLDWYSWREPFRSFRLNIYLNITLGIAKHFSAQPAVFYAAMLALDWLWTLPVMLLLITRGAKNLPIAAACTLAILATHNAIAHKEFRYIYPAIALAVPLAGLGLSAVWTSIAARGAPKTPRLCLGVALLLGPLFSPFLYASLQWETDSFKAFEAISHQPVHLVSVEALERGFTAGHPTFLPLDILFAPSVQLTSRTTVTTASGRTEADAIIAGQDTSPIPPEFRLQTCIKGNWILLSKTPEPKLCTWIRPPGPPPTGPASPIEFPFPAKARPFVVPDRLLPRPTP